MRRALSRGLISIMLTLCPLFFGVVEADDSAEVKALREQVENLQRTVEQLQNAVQSMQGAPARVPSPTPSQSAIDQFMSREGIGAEQRPIEQVETPVRTGGGAAQRYIDISFVGSFFGGASSKRDGALQTLQAGGNDPRKRGFTLAEGEIGLAGVVDPYFQAQTYITTFIDAQSGETDVELEEAFLSTRSLPWLAA